MIITAKNSVFFLKRTKKRRFFRKNPLKSQIMPKKSKTDTHPKNNLLEIGVRFVPVPACSSELQIRWNGIWGFAPPLIEPIRNTNVSHVVKHRACNGLDSRQGNIAYIIYYLELNVV